MSACIVCHQFPKALPRHRCVWCQLRQDGTDAEAAAAMLRRDAEPEMKDFPTVQEAYCSDCTSWVPDFYMKTKKRCRGCQLVLTRSKSDEKKYGLDPGTRQAWFVAQDGSCWGCGNRQRVTGLAVHHNHLTGEPFYLACMTCNRGVMGMAFDDPQILLRLALGMLLPPHRDGNAVKIEKIVEWLNGQK